MLRQTYQLQRGGRILEVASGTYTTDRAYHLHMETGQKLLDFVYAQEVCHTHPLKHRGNLTSVIHTSTNQMSFVHTGCSKGTRILAETTIITGRITHTTCLERMYGASTEWDCASVNLNVRPKTEMQLRTWYSYFLGSYQTVRTVCIANIN